MKIMISQPMQGKDPETIRAERADLVKQLTDEGNEVLDTIFTETAPVDTNTSLYFLGKSIEAMSQADAVVFMPGWPAARGCRLEHEIAISYKLYVKEL